jgi:hypothetical protein
MPFSFSDLLWSGEEVDVPAVLPGMPQGYESSYPAGENTRPVGLAQKMYIVADNICIVFCGINKEIRVFLAVFKSTFSPGEPISNDLIHDFLGAYRLERHFKQSTFFIIYIQNRPNGGITVNQFYCPQETYTVDVRQFKVEDGKWNILEEDVYEKTSACGSGTEGLLNVIRQPVQYQSMYPKGHFMRAPQTNASLIAKLLSLQITADYTLPAHWGGGFEIGYYNGNKFLKVDKITYVISQGQFTPEGDINTPIPRVIMHYKYVKNILYITTLEVHKYLIEETDTHISYTSEYGEYQQKIFEVPGIDVDNLDAIPMPTDFSFRSELVAVGYSLVTPGNTIFNPSFFNERPAVSIHFQQKKRLTVIFDKRLTEDIRRASQAHYPHLKAQFEAKH